MDASPTAVREVRPATEVRFRIAVMAGFVPCLESLGVSPDALLQQFGLRPADLVDPSRTCSYAVADALLHASAVATGCADVGLLLGQHVGLRTIGIVGRLMANSGTVADALENLRSTVALQDSALQIDLRRAGSGIALGVDVRASGLHHPEHVYDMVLAAACSVMRGLCGSGWCPDEVHLRRTAPADVRRYREFYRAPVRFGTGDVAMLFADAWLARPVRGADPLLRKVLAERVANDLSGVEPLLAGEVRRAVRTSLAGGRCSRATVAALLGVHERTLGRRLHAAGLSFQALLEETRAAVARDLLQDPDRSLSDIARALGYRDASVFTRAFARWTGTSPRDYRAGRAES